MARHSKHFQFFVYVGKVFSKAWGQSLSVSQNWLSLCLIIIWVLLMLAKAFHAARIIPSLEGILDMDYWMISTITLGAALVIRLALSPYWIYREQRQAFEKAQAEALDVSDKLASAREQIQTIGDFDVRQIPNTLGEMHNLVKNKIFEEKRKDSYAPEQSLKVIIGMLAIDPKSPLLSEHNYTDKRRVSHTIKVFRQRMGLKKNNPQKAKTWMHRIVKSLDDNNMGLDLKNNQEYIPLAVKLEKDRRPISTTRLSARIDDFVDALEGLYSIRLLTDYNKVRDYLHLLPEEAKDLLAELDKKTEAAMHSAMVNVNIPLEAWLIGASDDNRESD